MALGISITVNAQPPEAKGPGIEAAADSIMFDRLQEAMLRIKSVWPIRTSRSFNAWTVFRSGPLQYTMLNQARTKHGEYAGYVHRAGETQPLAETLVIKEIERAVVEIRRDFSQFKSTGRIPTVPSLPDVIKRQLRATIRKVLIARAGAKGAEKGGSSLLDSVTSELKLLTGG